MHFCKRQFVFIGLIIILSGILAACQSSSTPTLAAPFAPGISLGITDDTCPGVGAQVGQQVTWTNQDDREHIVRHKPAQGTSLFDSGTLQPGDSFAFTFLQPGVYMYLCSEDGDTLGTVTVQP